MAIADARTGRELRRLTREDAISALAFSADGKRLAVGEKDGTLSIIDPLLGSDLVRVKHPGRIVAVAFSADDDRLAAASEDKSVIVWNSTTGAETRRLTYEGSWPALAFGLTGPRLVASSNDDKKSWLLDVETGRTIVTQGGRDDQFYEAELTADASRFVTWADKKVSVWDASSGRLIWSHAIENNLRRAAMSPSGALVAIVDKADILTVLDTTDGRERFHLAHEGIRNIALSSDGRRIASGGEDNLVRLWDIPSGRELARLAHPGELGDLVFSPDGRRLVATSRLSDDAYAWGELAIWRADDWQQMGRLAAKPTGVWNTSFNRTGRILTTARGDMTVRLVDTETDSELGRLAFEKEVVSADLTSDDARLLVTTADHGAPELWDVGERRRLVVLSDPGGVDGIEFDSRRRLVATSGVDGTFRIWDAENGAELHRFKGNGCCLSADGRLYVRSGDNVIEVREVATDAVVSRLTSDKRWSGPLKLSPDGAHLVVMAPPDVELWDTAKQSLIARFDPQHSFGLFEFSPDGRLLATTGADDRVYLWDASTGQLIRQVQATATGFTSAWFSGDSRLLATGNDDAGVVSVWDTGTGNKVRDIAVKKKQNSFLARGFSPDGSRIAFGVGGTAQVWDIEKGQLVFETPLIRDKFVPNQLAFHSDGSLLAVGSLDAGSGVHLFDLVSGKERLRLQLDAGVEQLVFTADGKRLITYDDGHVARAWDILTGQEVFRFAHAGTAENIAYDAAKGRVATSNQAVAQVWDTASGRKIADFRFDDRIGDIALSPNGTRLAIHKEDSSDIAVLRVDGGLAGADVSAVTLFTLHHEKQIRAFAFSADGAMIVTGGEDNVHLWDTTTGKELARFTPQGRVTRVLLNDNNTVLAVSLDKSEGRREVEFWHVPTRQKTAIAPIDESDIVFRPGTATFAIANDTATVRIVQPEEAKPEYSRIPLGKTAQTEISPDGQLIAARRDKSKEVEIWDLQMGKQLVRFAHDDVLSYMDFTAGGRRLVTRGEDETTRLWDTRTGRELVRLAPTVVGGWLRFSTGGKRMVITRPRRLQEQEAQPEFEVYDTNSGAVIGKPIPIGEFVNDVSPSPDGKLLVTAEGKEERQEGEVVGPGSYVKKGFFGAKLWDVHTGQEIVKLPYEFPVYRVAFSSDGTLVMTQSNYLNKPLRLWSVPAGKLIAELAVPQKDLNWSWDSSGPVFSPDGRWLAASAANVLSIWRMTDYARVRLLTHTELINSFAFSRDGRLLAAKGDKEGLVWDLAAGRAIVRLRGMKSFQFTPNGKRLVTVHEDNTVRVWQLYADDLIADACSRLERNLSHEAWRTYLGEEPYRTTCSGLPVPER